MKRAAFFAFTLVLLVGSSTAQEMEAPRQVGVAHSGDDAVGQTLAYQLRERIKSSSQMELVDLSKAGSGVRINLTTLDPDQGEIDSGNVTVFSSTWIYFFARDGLSVQLYLGSQVGNYGVNRLDNAARNLTATADELRRRVPDRLADLALLLQSGAEQDGSNK
jgi:hypothetical protein